MSAADRKVEIDVFGLSEKRHSYSYDLRTDFFDQFEHRSYEGKRGTLTVDLVKTEVLLTLHIKLEVVVGLVCDRSLEPFDTTCQIDKEVYIKDGSAHRLEELDLDLYTLDFSVEKVDLSELIHELIESNLPTRKIHPDLDSEEAFNYSSVDSSEGEVAADKPLTSFQQDLEKLKKKFK